MTDQTQSLTSRRFFLRLAPLLLWTVLILVLSLIPSPPHSETILGWDKLQHAAAYGLLALLLARFLVQWQPLETQAWYVSWLTVVGFGVLLEVLQWSMNIGRTADWYDILANSIGSLIVCVIFRHIVLIDLKKQ
jgi:VanZ family protein